MSGSKERVSVTQAKPTVRVTDIGEYIRYHCCDRRFQLKFDNYKEAKSVPFFELIFETSLDPVLQEAGRVRENEWEASLQQKSFIDITQYSQKTANEDRKTLWDKFIEQLQNLALGQNAYGREIYIEADLGAFHISGQIDFVVVLWEGDQPKLRLVEGKASRKDRTYHRIQVALYQMMAYQMIHTNPVTINGVPLKLDDVECVIVRIDESTNKSQDILEQEPLNQDTEKADISRLMASDGVLISIVQRNLADLEYQLDEKCSDCVFSVHCLAESARERRLELLGLDPSTVRGLRAAGVNSIDDLATLDLAGTQAVQVRQDTSFSENLELLQLKAKTRRRTLPGGDINPDSYQVEQLPYSGQSQLPKHIINSERLVRVYLSVEYDYVENRIGALTAHITKSEAQLHTEGKDPVVKERWETGRDENNSSIYEQRPLQGKDVIKFKTSVWTGDYKEDTSAEKELIQGFLLEVVDAIADVAETEQAPIHFYVWSRQEMTQLVEGCSRVSSQLLGNLRELLGCRESLEQLIYSCLYDEVDRRYALGWTGRDLAVVTSLLWFGRRYHWCRRVSGVAVDLDRAFSQDIFDFKTDLNFDANGQWSTESSEDIKKRKFEIRLRFFNSLSAPYWRAFWRRLPESDDPKLQSAIHSYNNAQKPNYLREYLRARTHALRWVEEGICCKNSEITKPALVISKLPDFTLGVDNSAQAGIDFLRLDQHVKVTDWIATHLVPPIYRVPQGRIIPISDVVSHGNNKLTATINLDGYDLNYEVFQANCTIGENSFVRLSPCSDDSHNGQTLGQLLYDGSTCRVEQIDWNSGQIVLSVIPGSSDRYRLSSKSYSDEKDVFSYATLDESPSDFVSGRVDRRLAERLGTYVYQWFDPENPQIPPQQAPSAENLELYQKLLESLPLLKGRLDPNQVAAAVHGLKTRIQLLQGPPGTGKTETTAIATFLRILARRAIGDIVIIAAHTHTAVDNLLRRLDSLKPIFEQQATCWGLKIPPIQLSKVHSSQIESPLRGSIKDFVSKPCIKQVNQMRSNSVLVIGGTTSAILKMAEELGNRQAFSKNPQKFQVPTLIVDEASMMVFPHFLSLATLVTTDGEIMLAGDHRQLAPIVAHDWDQEDRPPVLLYQPYVSAYQAVQNLKQNTEVSNAEILRSALSFTFRLPPLIRELISRIYQLDDIQLKGRIQNFEEVAHDEKAEGSWERVWQSSNGLYLVLHSERKSKRSNQVEADIIEQILAGSGELPNSSVAIVTPHRAQRTLLKTRLANYYGNAIDVIDTVERLQGGERPTVIVSATASDPAAISKNVEFILDLNRSNVAFSRTQERLIVVCSDTLLGHIPAEFEHYESAMLWKSLRAICSDKIATESVDGHTVQIFTPPSHIFS